MKRILIEQRFITYRKIHSLVEDALGVEAATLVKEIEILEQTPEGDPEYLVYLSEQLGDIEYWTATSHRFALFQGIWSFFEERLVALCIDTQRATKCPFELTDISGQGIVRAFKYLEKVGSLVFVKTDADNKEIEILNNLRNIVAHRDGQLKFSFASPGLDPIQEHKNLVAFLVDNKIGDLQGMSIHLSGDFVPFAIGRISAFLYKIYKQHEARFPSAWSI